MVKGYCGHFGIKLAEEELEREALEWSTTRGSRSGRVAWQFTQELAGRLGGRLAGEEKPMRESGEGGPPRSPQSRPPPPKGGSIRPRASPSSLTPLENWAAPRKAG